MRESFRWWAGGLVAAGLIAGAATARGDGCSDCPPPSKAALEAEGMHLQMRDGAWPSRDTYETDGGECRVVIATPPTVRKQREWIEVEMTGESFNCPQGKMSSHVILRLEHNQKYEWHLDGSAGVDVGSALVAAFKVKVGGETGGGTGEGVTAEIDQTIEAAYCHRLKWRAYFIVGDFNASPVYFALERRFAWWTKNPMTGNTVQDHGQVWVVCETGDASFSRWQQISSSVAITDGACAGGCALGTGFMGWFPPPPGPTPPPNPFPPDGENAAPSSPATPPTPQPPPDPTKPVEPAKPIEPLKPVDPIKPPEPPPVAPPPQDPPKAPPPEPSPLAPDDYTGVGTDDGALTEALSSDDPPMRRAESESCA